jgi:hypothetical protein
MGKSDAKEKRSRLARAIKSERDYRGAAGVVKKLGVQADSPAASEQRLRALIREMDKFEEPPDDDDGSLDDGDYGGPLRRWSDDASGFD